MTGWREIIDKYYPEGTRLRDILLQHSHGVAALALEINATLKYPLDPVEVETAAMLHDIGIFLTNAPSIHCHGNLPYICHGYLGADLLRHEGIGEKYARVCERHTGTGLTREEIKENQLPLPYDRSYMPSTPLERLICYADKFYSKSGDMKRKSFDDVVKGIAAYGKSNLERFNKLIEGL